MRILQVIPVFNQRFGGPFTVVQTISKELVKRGHEVKILTTNAFSYTKDLVSKPVRYKQYGYEVISFPRSLYKLIPFNVSPQTLTFISDFIKWSDVIHLHSWRHFHDIVVCRYSKASHTPYVLQSHGSLVRKVGMKTVKLLYDFTLGLCVAKAASKIIALNRLEVFYAMKLGVPREKIVIMPNGVELAEYKDLPRKGSFRKKFRIPATKKIILYLGRIHWIKGLDILVKACYLMKKCGYRNFVLVIVGPDDGYLHIIKRMVTQLRLQEFILFTGPLYGKMKLAAYTDADVYVLPSRYETFPMTVLEAYACGVPVIASDIEGLKEIVVNGKTGYLFSLQSTMDLTTKILTLLTNEYLRKRFSKEAVRLVRTKFSVEKAVNLLEHVYERVVG